MPVPFGFSVGDFIAIISLFKDLTLALQERGGSSSDYQKTAIDLETIATILLELQSLQPVDSNHSQINSIRGQAYRVYHDVQQFLSSIKELDSKLGPLAALGFHRSPITKIKWSQFTAVKVKELREAVHLQTANIQLLLGLLIQHNQKVDRALFEVTFVKHSLAIESLAEQVKSIERTLRQDRALAKEQITGALQRINGTNGATADSSSVAQHHNRQDRIHFHASAISLDGTPAFAQQTRRILPIRNLQNIPGSLNEGRVRESTIKTCAQYTQSMSVTGASPHGLEWGLDPQVMPFRKISADIIFATFDCLTLKANEVLQQLVGSLVAFLKELLSSLLLIVIFLRLLRQIPRAVSLVCQDNIRFEDALGRMQSLQYQHFRHWTVFEACLRCSFKNTPGMQKVFQGQFVLKCPRAPDEVLDATNWEKNASPGMVVTMSISISTILAPSGSCPRGCSAGRAAVSGSEARCTSCNLTFSVTRSPNSDILRSMKFIGPRSKPLMFRTIRMRNRIPTETINSEEYKKRKRRESATRRLGTQLKTAQAQVSNLMRYERSYKEQEEHRLEEQDIIHFKRIHLVEDTVLKWTWTFGVRDKPWYWAWHVELPEVRAEWKTAEYWKSISPALLTQIVEGQISEGPENPPEWEGRHLSPHGLLAMQSAKQFAFQFSQAISPSPPLSWRTYTLTYTGSLSFSDNWLAVAKVPFVHLLATQPLTPHRIRSLSAMSEEHCDQLLWIFARDCPADPDKQELREVSYRELDVWGFPYPSKRSRRSAIERSIQAFDVLQIDRHDNLWQLLLPVERRGKGICLSKRSSD